MSGAGAASLSLVVITRNEAGNLAGCLDSVPFATEIVVVDDESTDATRDVAARYTDKVVCRKLDRFGRQKQFAIEQAACDWVLVLDADERLDEQLAAAIRGALERDDGEVDGYLVRRLTRLFGRPIRHGGWFKANHLRLFRRGRARFIDRRVHEYAVLENPARRGVLAGQIDHDTYSSMAEWHAKIDRYSRLAARDWYDMGRRAHALSAPHYFVLRPLSVFLREYVTTLGFLDGWAGLRIALMATRADVLTARRLWKLTAERREREPEFF